ncbi:hypothetical protein AVEN_196682-1 [Araneus ventricosus]|uniref:Uncharacterized protein n=1 Tax=Araneus ventricosus TaxID=182803 RepID=A0A4Y2RZK5_ARAVE|nr:hypothetical protein AVEN_196682-1 [Araneus ventricosus]
MDNSWHSATEIPHYRSYIYLKMRVQNDVGIPEMDHALRGKCIVPCSMMLDGGIPVEGDHEFSFLWCFCSTELASLVSFFVEGMILCRRLDMVEDMVLQLW